MPTKTYKPIATVTLGSNVASYTFSSIPQTYTDLVLVSGNVTGATSDQNFAIQVGNGSIDTGSNYSASGMYANPTSTYSWRTTNSDKINITYAIGLNTKATGITSIMNYSSTTKYKTSITRSGGTGGTYNGVELNLGMWRSNSAIDTIKVLSTGTLLYTGSTFTLYGIL